MRKLTYLFLIAAAVITGCSKDKNSDIPQPTACITADKTQTTVGESIAFTNCSTNGSTYEWDFGDGTNSTSTSPSHSYTAVGTYTVRLTVYSQGKAKQDTKSMSVYVGKKYITRIDINQMPWVSDDGSSWDFSNGPDVYFAIRKTGTANWSQLTQVYSDLKQSDLPGYIDTDYLLDGQYDIAMYDNDDPDDDDLIGYWTGVNPSGHTSQQLTGNATTVFDIKISYQIK